MFLCIVLSSCAHTMPNTYIKLLRVLSPKLSFSCKFHGATFSVCDLVPNGQLRHAARAQPAQSLYLSSSWMLATVRVERCLERQQPFSEQLLGHQGMTHRKTFTSLIWCLKASPMSFISLMYLRIRFSCVLCIVPLFFKHGLETTATYANNQGVCLVQ